MVEIHEYRGLWWLPTDDGKRPNEDNQLSGTLTVTKGRAALELLGHFGHEILYETETEKVGSGHLAEQPRILGLSNEGKRLTLEGHQSAPYTEHFPGIPTATYNRTVTLIGKHFAPREKILFDEIVIEASDLNAWTQVRAIATKAQTRRRKGGYHVWSSVSGRWKPVRDIPIPLARGALAFIHFGAQFSGIDALGRPGVRMSLEQNAALHLRFTRRVSLEEVFERVGHIRNFLSLAVGRPVAVLSVTGYQDDYADERTKLPIPIELFWGIPHNPDPPEKPRDPREMLFTLPEASPDISKVMRSWFAKQARLRPVFNLFFGMLYHPDMYSDVRFLMFAQAVETYGYRRRRKVVERPFADQVKDVLGNCRTVSRKIVGDDEDAWVKWLKVTRDFYTHYNPKKEKAAAKDAGRFLLTVQLRAIIEMSLLRELGFTPRAIDQILDRVGRYREIEHFKMVVADEEAPS
jgi:hypothetical protein